MEDASLFLFFPSHSSPSFWVSLVALFLFAWALSRSRIHLLHFSYMIYASPSLKPLLCFGEAGKSSPFGEFRRGFSCPPLEEAILLTSDGFLDFLLSQRKRKTPFGSYFSRGSGRGGMKRSFDLLSLLPSPFLPPNYIDVHIEKTSTCLAATDLLKFPSVRTPSSLSFLTSSSLARGADLPSSLRSPFFSSATLYVCEAYIRGRCFVGDDCRDLHISDIPAYHQLRQSQLDEGMRNPQSELILSPSLRLSLAGQSLYLQLFCPSSFTFP